ncbi:hypothetical protein GGR50DRAFT_692432 [Xylaria sp. CBS 124048]|nr:hypothetical protein GGR50DRAFT_692432 [Xylaria sp. CBS 124048]
MKTITLPTAMGSALLLLAAHPCYANNQQHLRHRHHHHHHHHHHHTNQHRQQSSTISHKRDSFTFSNATVNPRYEARRSDKQVQARDGASCEFPLDKGAFAVTPGLLNGGWALSPDMECTDGMWCPIACPPGQLMAQWKPDTHYAYPESTYGGIYCDGGEISVPFEDQPWCVDGTGTVTAVNKAGGIVSFCQTVLPGYEDMLIPTDVLLTATLAVPDPSYWDSTAAHFYVNAPGIDSAEGCIWGDESRPIGNWAPYVAGANMDESGETFVKVGINPVWESSALSADKPSFGLKIECDGDCNGLPCQVDGDGVVSDNKATGAGGSDFCVVTVPKGGQASIVVYNVDGGISVGYGIGVGVEGDDEVSTSSSAPASTSESISSPSSPSSTPSPSSTSTTSSSVPALSSTTISIPASSSSLSRTPTTSSTPVSSTSTFIPTSTSPATPSTSSYEPKTTSSASLASTSVYFVSPSSSSSKTPFLGGVYRQNGTVPDMDDVLSDPTPTSEPAAVNTGESERESESKSDNGSGAEYVSKSQSDVQDVGQAQGQSQSQGQVPGEIVSMVHGHTENSGRRQDGAAVAGLVVAFVAAVYLL